MGCGIVVDFMFESEYEEIRIKFNLMFLVLGGIMCGIY